MRRGNDPFEDLLSGRLVVYEVIQLWNYRDKIKGDDFETEILEGIRQAAAERGVVLEGFPVFLPFRDSDEEDIQSDDKAGEIYRADCLRLTEQCFSVIGFTEGLAKDAGVMWEYGFAYAVGLPTLLFVSDFFCWRMVRPGGRFRGETFVVDPLVDACIGKVVVENDLPLDGEPLLPTEKAVVPQLRKQEQFRRRLERGRAKLLERVREETRAMCLDAGPFIASPPHKRGGEGGAGGEGEGQASGGGHVFVEGEGWDVAPGSAFLQGYAAALGIPIVVYYGGDRIFEAHGGTRMWVNLMLECSAQVMAHSLDEIPTGVGEALQITR